MVFVSMGAAESSLSSLSLGSTASKVGRMIPGFLWGLRDGEYICIREPSESNPQIVGGHRNDEGETWAVGKASSTNLFIYLDFASSKITLAIPSQGTFYPCFPQIWVGFGSGLGLCLLIWLFNFTVPNYDDYQKTIVCVPGAPCFAGWRAVAGSDWL